MGQDDAPAPPAFTKTNASQSKAYLDGEAQGTVLTHHVLLDMGQGGLKAYFSGLDCDSEPLQNVRRIWQNLLATTRSTAVTDRHLTATCNAMCVFLECACSSLLPHVRLFGMSKETWTECFGAILESFAKGTLKPMRQVLITLANMLTHHTEEVASISIQKDVMAKITGVVLLGEAEHMKAALVVIELFIRKVSSFDGVLNSIKSCLQDKRVEWSRRLASFGFEKVVGELPVQASRPGTAAPGSECWTTMIFVTALFMGLLSRDTQSAAIAVYNSYSSALIRSGRGNHLYSIFTSEQGCNAKPDADNSESTNQSPWILLVNAFFAVHPAAVTPFADLLFPAVFRHDPHGYKEYAGSLRKDGCNLVNALAVVQVGCHNGLERGKLRRCAYQDAMQLTKTLTPTLDPAFILTRIAQSVDVHSDQTHDIYGTLLSHADGDVRIRTFALLLASSSTTAPLSDMILQCLAGHMKYLYSESDPQSRSEVMSIVRKLVIRLQGGACSLHKSMINPQSQPEEDRTGNRPTDLRQHEKFLVWFAKFLEDELRPNVSYQRHIMALKSIDLLVRSGLDNFIAAHPPSELSRKQMPWPIHVSLHEPSLTYAVLNLVMDPFEDVRFASSILLEILASAAMLPMHKHIHQMVRKAEQLASRTRRADHADGAGRLYKLYYTVVPASSCSFPDDECPLLSKRTVIEQILSPVQRALADVEGRLDVPLQQLSLHGRLLSLRYLLQDQSFPGDRYEDNSVTSLRREHLIASMIHLCQQVWEKVRYRLCVDSPENSEDEPGEEVVFGPKDMLSYSWRALRDSSLLLCAILDAPIFREPRLVSASRLKCFDEMGALCMEQLSDLRHRGAFSTVAQTFSVLCERIAESDDDSVAQLRDVWYDMAVATLEKQSARLTRRSAGLPAMMAGLLNACPQVFFERFLESFTEKAMKNSASVLLSENEDRQIELPQVHALNCLREVFTNAKFRTITEPHVTDMLNLAAIKISSDIWAIRNCGLMLFRACTSRLGRARISLPVGQDISRSRASEATVSMDRAPEVLELVIKLIDRGCFSQNHHETTLITQPQFGPVAGNYGTVGPLATETVFAALDLIGRISPAFDDKGRIETLILEQLASTVWQVREQAAMILASRVSHWDAFGFIGRLVDGMFIRKDQNMVHGRLLCIKQILHRLWRFGAGPQRNDLGQAGVLLGSLVAPLMADKLSSVVQSTFLDIMNEAFEINILLHAAEDDSTESAFWIGEAMYTGTALSDGPEFPKHECAALQEAYHFLFFQSNPDQEPSSSPKLGRLFRNLAKADLDAAARFLDRITSQTSWNRNIHYHLDELYQYIIVTDLFPEDLKSRAMTALTTSFERNQFDRQRSTTLTQVHCCLLCDSVADGRDLRNAKLRLQANLFSLCSQEGLTQDYQVCANAKCHLSLWVAMLEDACWDDIDTQTRLDAASSLLAFTPLLAPEQTATSLSLCYLQIYFVLYDLLNDDDEDVREIAASAASTILDSGQAVQRTQFELSPLAASERLAKFVGTEFRSDPRFSTLVLRRIWFSSSLTLKRGASGQGIEYYSAKVLLEKLNDDSTALFEEEKQNLYVDDIREVGIWSSILKRIPPPEQCLLNSLGKWIMAALQDLSDHLKDNVDFDGPLGLTSQADVLTLFVRIIELAGIMLHWADCEPNQTQEPWSGGDFETIPTASHWVDGISYELKALRELGSRVCIHERITRSIDENLKM